MSVGAAAAGRGCARRRAHQSRGAVLHRAMRAAQTVRRRGPPACASGSARPPRRRGCRGVAASPLDDCVIDWSRHHAQVLIVEAGAHGVRARLAEGLLHRAADWLSYGNVLIAHACGVPPTPTMDGASSVASSGDGDDCESLADDSPEAALCRAALLGEASRLGVDARCVLARPRMLWHPPRARQDLLSNVLHPAVVGDLDAHELVVCLDAEAREHALAFVQPASARADYAPTVRMLAEFAPLGAEAVRRAARGERGPGPLVPPLDAETTQELMAHDERRLAAALDAHADGALGVAVADASDLEGWQRMADALLVATLGVAVFAVESFQRADVPDYDPL